MRIDLDDTDWLLGKIRDGVVGLGVGYRYHLTIVKGAQAVDCDSHVYALEDAGLVHLTPSGDVALTTTGRARYDAHLKATTAARRERRQAHLTPSGAPAVVFQPAAA